MRLLTGFFAMLSAVSFTASGALLNDPEMVIDGDCCSIPISSGINQVQPTGASSVTYDFFNDSPNIITSFIFQTTINKGLSSAASASFTCTDPGGFFLNCVVFYDPATGTLRYTFSGVNPPDGDEGTDTEIGQMEGIPPASSNPVAVNGHFKITLNGWVTDATSGGEQLYSGVPHVDGSFTETPEPSAALAIGTGLMLLGLLRYRRRAVR